MVELRDDVSTRDVDQLIPYANNPKKHSDEQVDKIASSIKNYGFVQPLVVDEAGEVVIGHGRLQAAKKLGMDKVPVICIDDLSDAELQALRLADNKVAESGWDDELLGGELQQLNDEFTGFDDTEFADIQDDQTEVDEVEADDPDQVETDIQEGEVYRLGDHRLMCGDATNINHVETLLDGAEIDLVFTDPPYGINVVEESGVLQGDGKKETAKSGVYAGVEAKEYKPVEGDDSTDTAREHIEIAQQYTDDMILWGGNYFADFLPPSRGWIVWDKRNEGTDFADCELAWTSFDHSLRMYDWLWSGMYREGDRDVEGVERSHPTQKPVGLTVEIIEDFVPDTHKPDTILDCFAGAGTTVIAAEQIDAAAYVMELDPYYCQVIINRWEDLTGMEAEKVVGVE